MKIVQKLDLKVEKKQKKINFWHPIKVPGKYCVYGLVFGVTQLTYKNLNYGCTSGFVGMVW